MYGPQGDKCGKMASRGAICGVMGIFKHREDDETALFLQKLLRQMLLKCFTTMLSVCVFVSVMYTIM